MNARIVTLVKNCECCDPSCSACRTGIWEPAEVLGVLPGGRAVFRAVEGYRPLDGDGDDAKPDIDGDGNWVERFVYETAQDGRVRDGHA